QVPSPMGRVSLGRKRHQVMQRRKIWCEEIAIRRTVFLVAAGRDSSPVFSVESNKGSPGILFKRPKTDLTGRPGRHHSVHVRSKYFKKSEKKACHASKTSVILTAKPNQTNGETNDKIRTENVRILPLGSRSRRRTSFPYRRERLRAGGDTGTQRSHHRASYRHGLVYPDCGNRIGFAGYGLHSRSPEKAGREYASGRYS